ncbi:hypothetical protein CB0940_06772 [Cercospora beticola]|uniref:Uncharacterized protein n=1 Tax=Cercospora beticola TaxID=122368 RepID=A0A2G5H8M0_CERBT|nr:hypothetical protein CB0940_06772 [Cercospora beticola]PIA88877.1 hypothetical protein CB0940_06772 [Cercospora beticola]WPB02684.1 hypothetical protein RHO25_007320 [Cercospora beticola]
MPKPTWQIEERRTLFVLKVALGLSDDESHDLMGRIFGGTWRNATDPPRKKYGVNDLRDEVKFRWSAGKRHQHWNTIDPEDGPSDEEQRAQTSTLGTIVSAARQTDQVNWLLTNDKGVMTRQLSVIPIPDAASRPHYQRDPATFDRNFYGSERKAPKRKQENPESGPRKQPLMSKHPATQHSDSTATTSVAESTPQRSTEPTADMKRPDPLEHWTGWHVDMVHEKWYLERRQQLESGAELTGSQVPEYIFEDCGTRQFGGQLVRIYNPSSTIEFEDALVCPSAVCDQCTGLNNLEDKRIADLVPGVEVTDGPTKGLPFVHRKRDVKLAFGGSGRLVFNQAKDVDYQPLVVPERTKLYVVRCMVRTKKRDQVVQRDVKVLGCVPESCEVCNPELAQAREAEKAKQAEKAVKAQDEVGGAHEGENEEAPDSAEEEHEAGDIEEPAKSDSDDSDYDEPLRKKRRGKAKKSKPNRVLAGK